MMLQSLECAAPVLLPAEPVHPVTRWGPAPDAERTVLLVEDEEMVRDVVREVLELSGYRVLPASRGSEALRLAAGHPGPIHLLLTDVVMPGMSGGELAQRLNPLRPEMRVLYMSGYTEEEVRRHGVIPSAAQIIPKPFRWGPFAERIRAAMSGEA